MPEETIKENSQPEKERNELSPDDLEMVSGGSEKPVGTEENIDKPILENIQDNKGANE